MTNHRPMLSTILVAALLACMGPASAQDSQAQAALPKPTAMQAGGTLSGALTVMRDKRGISKHSVIYQLVSEPRRLPPPAGLCNLENGPETFQIVPAGDAQASQLKSHRGKQVSLKVDAVACAVEAGQISEAVVTKWSLLGN
jgi:hypothetical protein